MKGCEMCAQWATASPGCISYCNSGSTLPRRTWVPAFDAQWMWYWCPVFFFNAPTPTVGPEPTTTRLRALRSAD